MSGPIFYLGAVAGVIVSLGASAVGAQQQVKVTVAAVPNPIAAGSCTRIWADVRDEQNRLLTLENGVPLKWDSYDYTMSNGTDFEWRKTATEEFELCAKAGAGAVSTEVTATIKGMPHSGNTLVAVGAQAAAASPNAGGVAPGSVASASPTPAGPQAAGPQPSAAPATVPAQPYVPPPANAPAAQGYAPPAQTDAPPAQANAPPAQTYAPPAQTYVPPQTAATNSPPPPAAQPPVAAAPPPQAQAQPVKSGGGFFKKLGSHIKQKAAEVKNETTQNLTAAATGIVDTTFQTGSRLVASTTAEVTNTARMGIGGVGRQLMLAPQRGGANADNLAVAIASGRAVLLEMRFTPNTDVLEPAARELVLRVAEELKKAVTASPTSSFVIEAHVDDSAPNGQVLSEYRAAAVKVALVRSGVDASRLMALGYGASRPSQAGGPPVARVEIARAQ